MDVARRRAQGHELPRRSITRSAVSAPSTMARPSAAGSQPAWRQRCCQGRSRARPPPGGGGPAGGQGATRRPAPGREAARPPSPPSSRTPMPTKTRSGRSRPSGMRMERQEPGRHDPEGGERHGDQVREDAIGRHVLEVIGREGRGGDRGDQRRHGDAEEIDQERARQAAIGDRRALLAPRPVFLRWRS